MFHKFSDTCRFNLPAKRPQVVTNNYELLDACQQTYCPLPLRDELLEYTDLTSWSEEELTKLSEDDLLWWWVVCEGQYLVPNLNAGK